MSFKAQAITIIPAFIVFLLASYLSILSLIAADPALKQQAFLLAVALFYGGLAMAAAWIAYWAFHKVTKFSRKFSTVRKTEES